jgi:hypothetical protein
MVHGVAPARSRVRESSCGQEVAMNTAIERTLVSGGLRRLKRSGVVLGLLVSAALVPGCLEFDGQEIRLRYDSKKDRLDVLLIYRGVYVEDSGPPRPSEKSAAEQQLDALLEGKRWVALLSNFPFVWNFDSEEAAQDPFVSPFVRNVSVENGRFFRDAEGRISAWQIAHVERVSDVLGEVNAAFLRYLGDPESFEEARRALVLEDAESERLLRRALQNKRPFFLRRGGAFVFSVPASAEGYGALVAAILRGFAEQVERDRPGAAEPSKELSETDLVIGFLSSLEISFIRSGDATEFVLGNPEKLEQVFRMPARGRYRENLAPLLEERNVPIATDVTLDHIRRTF